MSDEVGEFFFLKKKTAKGVEGGSGGSEKCIKERFKVGFGIVWRWVKTPGFFGGGG